MKEKHDLGLNLSAEEEKKVVFSSLTKTTRRYKKIFSDLIDAAYEIQKKKKLTAKQLKLFEQGVRIPYEQVFFYYSGMFLCKLSHTYKNVENLFIELSSDSNSTVRFNNITTMLGLPTKRVLNIVIANGLTDKSTRVRSKAADVINRLQLKRFASELQAYIEKEENVKVKKSLEYSLYWLTHDYETEKSKHGGYDLRVKTLTGYHGLTITNREYRDIVNVVKEIKKDSWNWRKNYQKKKNP